MEEGQKNALIFDTNTGYGPETMSSSEMRSKRRSLADDCASESSSSDSSSDYRRGSAEGGSTIYGLGRAGVRERGRIGQGKMEGGEGTTSGNHRNGPGAELERVFEALPLRVAKDFDGETYKGTVAEFWSPYFMFAFDDCDEEERELKEVNDGVVMCLRGEIPFRVAKDFDGDEMFRGTVE